jgi:hypothetical protein
MLHARRFESLFCEMRTKNANFGRKWEIGEVFAAVRKLLFHFKYLDASDAGLMFVFLSARQFTSVASRTILVVDQ